MGSPRLTPGQGVDALDEAIDIIRGIWDADERTPAAGPTGRTTGSTAPSAVRRPAHDIPIWLGAYKPRMLGLVGAQGRRVAAEPRLPAARRPRPQGTRRSTTPAQAAGRDPREIRRLLNLGGGSFSRRRLPAGAARAVGRRPAPAGARGRDRARSSSAATTPRTIARLRRGGRAGAARGGRRRACLGRHRDRHRPARRPPWPSAVPGIDYDALPASLVATAVEPGDREYGRVRSSYVYAGSPGLVAAARATPQDVSDALAFARAQDVPFAVRSGGHGISGRSTNDGGIVIDVGALDTVEVLDRERRLVRLGAGARWGDVAAALSPHGLAISSGDYGDVGRRRARDRGRPGLPRAVVRPHARPRGRRRARPRRRSARAHRRRARARPAVGGARRGRELRHPHGRRDRGRRGRQRRPRDDRLRRDRHRAVRRRRGPRWSRPRRASSPASSRWSPARGQNPAVGYTIVVWANDDTEAAVVALERFLDLAPVLQQQAQLVPYAATVAAHHGEHTGGADAGQPRRARRARDARARRAARRSRRRRRRRHGPAAGGRRRRERRRPGGHRLRAPDPELLAARVRSAAAGARRSTRGGSGSRRTWTASTSASRRTSPPPGSPRRSRRATLARIGRLKAVYDPDHVFDGNFGVAPPPAEPVPR